MLTAFQQKKLTRLFYVYDLNKDRVIDIHDYKVFLDNITRLQGILTDSPLYQGFQEHYLQRWKDLQSVSDTNQDNMITLGEWLFYHEAVIGFTEIYHRIVSKSVQELFDIFDLDKDERISYDEFAIFYRAYGLDEDIASNIFCRLDVDPTDRISKESFLNLFDQFYRSDNPQDLGNSLFGDLNDNY